MPLTEVFTVRFMSALHMNYDDYVVVVDRVGGLVNTLWPSTLPECIQVKLRVGLKAVSEGMRDKQNVGIVDLGLHADASPDQLYHR